MPINDSAGVGVYLIDKSQRSSVAIGFRAAGAIEADRGLCNAPTLISSDADYVKVFGSPNVLRHGRAAMEAYMLAQRKVPQVLVRAKNPELPSNATPFGVMQFKVGEDGKLDVNTTLAGNDPTKKPDEGTTFYFKGEGQYPCKKLGGDEINPINTSNIVLRFSQPLTQSAYAKDGRSLFVQVFDFDGANHIDQDTHAELAFNPDVSNVIDTDGLFQLDGYSVGGAGSDDGSDAGTDNEHILKITAYVNGKVGTLEKDYSAIGDYDNGVFDMISDAVRDAKDSEGKTIISAEWDVPFQYAPDVSGSDSGEVSADYGSYFLDSRIDGKKQSLNCFNLSITVTMNVTLPIHKIEGGRELAPGFYTYPCGNVTVSKVKGTTDEYEARFNVSTNFYLKNRNTYMFMGEQNEYWASYYETYCKESKTLSFSYEDYDANYVTMQADAVLSGSNYLVSKSVDDFGDYTIDYENDPITNELKYFDSTTIDDNTISGQQKSYAYSVGLTSMLGDNLTRWRCLATTNYADVMNPSDFNSVISAANESTLGVSNIGAAASTDVFGNLTGRHGNRFIADYSQYAYRTLLGKRTPVTVACLVTDLLNSHYNAGIEARPPFGPNYGEISCISLSQQFTGAERNMLARQLKINPVNEDGGYFLWDERTSQLTETSLSDIHCIISFIWMKFAIYDAMKSFVAEYNDESTVNRGLAVLNQLNQTFITRNYIQEGIVSADKNVLGDEVLRFDYAVRFKGVARFVDVYITAYSQTQTLAISLAGEA